MMSKIPHLLVRGLLCVSLACLAMPAFAGQITTISPNRAAVIQPVDRSEEPRLLAAFDLTPIGRDRRIDFAQVTFCGDVRAERDLPGPGRLDVLPLTTDWQENDVNWDAPWDSAGGDVDLSLRTSNWFTASAADTQDLWFDVTRIVKGWKDGSIPNRGLVIKISDLTPANLEGMDPSRISLKVWHHAERK